MRIKGGLNGLLLSAVLISLFAGLSSFGGTLHVSPSGNHTPPYSKEMFAAILFLASSQVLASDLMIGRDGEEVILKWPLASASDYYLQCSTHLASTDLWQEVPDASNNGIYWAVSVNASYPSYYFLATKAPGNHFGIKEEAQ